MTRTGREPTWNWNWRANSPRSNSPSIVSNPRTISSASASVSTPACANARAHANDAADGFVKIIADAATDKILGAMNAALARDLDALRARRDRLRARRDFGGDFGRDLLREHYRASLGARHRH